MVSEVGFEPTPLSGLLKKSTDPYLALLCYRSTPLQNGFSSAELLMGRKLRIRLPTLPSNLDPGWDF